jgi:hypothetical protein
MDQELTLGSDQNNTYLLNHIVRIFIGMRILLILLLVFVSCFHLAADPIGNFCSKNKIVSNSILIAVSPNDCAGCMLSMDELIMKLREINSAVPIHIITRETLSDTETLLFKNKLGVGAFNIELTSDESAFEYLISKKQGLPTMCYVSEKSKILSIKNLKDDDLNAFFELITPPFEIHVSKTVELQNKYISSYRGGSNFSQIGDKFYIYYEQYHLISEYNKSGENTKNVFVDSLKFNYLELAKKILSKADYEASVEHYNSIKVAKKKETFINPTSLSKIGSDTLALATQISTFKDSLYNGKEATYEGTYTCLLLFNKDLRSIGHLKFNPQEAKRIETNCQFIYVDSSLFFLKYNDSKHNYFLAEYKINADSLHRVAQIEEPFNPKEEDPLQVISPHNGPDQSAVFITYKSKRKLSQVYRFDVSSRTFKQVIESKNTSIFGYAIHETKKGNYLLLARKPSSKEYYSLGYHGEKHNFIECNDLPKHIDKRNSRSSFFTLNNNLVEIIYCE